MSTLASTWQMGHTHVSATMLVAECFAILTCDIKGASSSLFKLPEGILAYSCHPCLHFRCWACLDHCRFHFGTHHHHLPTLQPCSVATLTPSGCVPALHLLVCQLSRVWQSLGLPDYNKLVGLYNTALTHLIFHLRTRLCCTS